MGAIERYGLRLERKRYLVRAWRKARELELVVDRTFTIREDDVICALVLRDEKLRLPFLLEYYRKLGVGHFLIVDNGSTDGGREFLADQPDCSVWLTETSYKRARFGMDWINGLLGRYGHGHWCLTIDADEFLVYPFCDTRPLPALTYWLENASVRALGTMVLDMYPRGPVGETRYSAGENPFATASWFDSGNYTISRNWKYGNLWIQGGPRARTFFADAPAEAPALNKIPLVKWHKRYAYVSSTHMLLPRGLNLVFDESGGEKASGVLMHAKFLGQFRSKAEEEILRREHYAGSREYEAYARGIGESPDLWTRFSERYRDWRQLEILGLMSKGNWA
ncbi:glycosyltransferase family 2 protein [Rhodobacterales bacterium HKCCE3408]|nr:glycosyltransferase family 2 protein [Rhodobacterales bacterium HKCCE3408]